MIIKMVLLKEVKERASHGIAEGFTSYWFQFVIVIHTYDKRYYMM